MARRQAAVPRGVSHSTPVFAASADGVRVTDVDGNVYLDFAGGIGVMNVGHSNPHVVDALHRQVNRFTHTGFSVAPYESYVALAERLAALTPGSFPKKTLFVNSGAEAIENAVKIARHATGRPGVMCFEDGFHGRTLLALSLTARCIPTRPDTARSPPTSGACRSPIATAAPRAHASRLRARVRVVARGLLQAPRRSADDCRGRRRTGAGRRRVRGAAGRVPAAARAPSAGSTAS